MLDFKWQASEFFSPVLLYMHIIFDNFDLLVKRYYCERFLGVLCVLTASLLFSAVLQLGWGLVGLWLRHDIKSSNQISGLAVGFLFCMWPALWLDDKMTRFA